MDSDLKPKVLNEATNEIISQYLDASKARKLLNWKPLFSLDEGGSSKCTTLAIWAAIGALWPWILRHHLDLDARFVWGLLLAALVAMVVVAVRRLRRLDALRWEDAKRPRGKGLG